MFGMLKNDKQMSEGLHFNEPVLGMSYVGRFSSRVIMSAWIIVHTSATIIFILSDVPSVFWLGFINAIYLLDRLSRYRDADQEIPSKAEDVDNLAYYITPRAKRMLVGAFNKASMLGGGLYLNVALVLLDTKPIQKMLARMEIKREEFEAKLNSYLSKETTSNKDKNRLLSEAETLVITAFNARDAGQKNIDYADLFAALGGVNDENVKSLLHLFDADGDTLRRAAIFGRLSRMSAAQFRKKHTNPFSSKHRVMNKAWTARPTPMLDSFSTDLTDFARRGRIGFLIGHREEYERLVNILSRSAKPNVLLVADSGIGKRAIVEHLAYQIVKNEVPEEIFDKRVVSLDVGGLVAGADQAEVQRRVREVFNEIYRAGNVLLFVPNIHDLARTSGPGTITAASNILPLIASQDFPTVGSTTPHEFKQFIETDSLFREAFETLRIEEVTIEEANHILTYKAVALENEHKVTIAYRAIKAASGLAKKYFHEVPLPSSAEDLLRETISYVSNRGDNVITSEDVISVVEQRVNIPIHSVMKGEAQGLLNLEETIHKRLIGQEEAVKAVSTALREYRSGLSNSDGPIGTFLFVGPTGVGKTELAKTLAQIQFGSEDSMIRFDMSEYQDTESIHRLIGSPDGSVSGSLTDAIIKRPYSLILLDEFEKAHRDILELFLQVFDDGRLTDNLGRTVSFENTVIISTSNAEATFIVDGLRSGKSMGDLSDELRNKLINHFSPELLNRFSAIVIFKSLSEEDIKAIARIHLANFARQLKETNDITLIIDEELVSSLAKLGYDPTFGARPLERAVSDNLRAPLAEKILAGEIKKDTKIRARLENNILQIYEAK